MCKDKYQFRSACVLGCGTKCGAGWRHFRRGDDVESNAFIDAEIDEKLKSCLNKIGQVNLGTKSDAGDITCLEISQLHPLRKFSPN